jgi:hypothetical protein
MQAHVSFATLILSLALLVPASAGASSQRYVLAATSTITLTGGSAQLLTGEIELTFKGLCVVPFDHSTCLLGYDFDAIDLSGAGENIVLGSVTSFNGQLLLPPSLFGDFSIDFPGAPDLDDFILDRHTVTPQFPESARFSEQSLSSPDPNAALAAVFDADDPLPSEIFFDVLLIDKTITQVLLGGGAGWTSPSTISTDIVARLSIHAVAVPEPASGALLALGLAALGAHRRARS